SELYGTLSRMLAWLAAWRCLGCYASFAQTPVATRVRRTLVGLGPERRPTSQSALVKRELSGCSSARQTSIYGGSVLLTIVVRPVERSRLRRRQIRFSLEQCYAMLTSTLRQPAPTPICAAAIGKPSATYLSLNESPRNKYTFQTELRRR